MTGNEGRIVLSLHSPATDPARAATALSRELLRQGVPVLTPTDGTAPTGSKGGIIVTAGSVIIGTALTAQLIRSVTQIVLALIQRRSAGAIRLEHGDRKIEIENASRETEQSLVAWLSRASSHDAVGE